MFGHQSMFQVSERPVQPSGVVSLNRIRQVVEILDRNRVPVVDGSYYLPLNMELFNLSRARAGVLRAKLQTSRRGVPKRGLRRAQWWVRFCKEMLADLMAIPPSPSRPHSED